MSKPMFEWLLPGNMKLLLTLKHRVYRVKYARNVKNVNDVKVFGVLKTYFRCFFYYWDDDIVWIHKNDSSSGLECL